MAVKKEQVVLIVTALVLGWMAYGVMSETDPRVSRSRSEELDFEAAMVPNVAVALPDPKRGTTFERNLFSAPRDTAPLPALELTPPPLEPLEGLAPPSAWGPAPDVMARFVRRPLSSAIVPGVFPSTEELDAELDIDEPIDDGGFDVGNAADDGSVGGPVGAEERMERIAGYRRLYDWIRIRNEIFGQIRNEDRYGLSQRDDEPVLFVEIDPETGQERFPGQEPISYGRERVQAFGFADTVANRIELQRRQFGASLRAPELEAALALADECIEKRLEAPRALEIAEEMFGLAKKVADGDPRPDLGLARCYEAGFRFEDAFTLYRELLASGHGKDPVVHARLGSLRARFRMFETAEVSFIEALRWGRTQWEPRWRYGRFLSELGRFGEAVEQLKQANKYEPKNPEAQRTRGTIRADLGWALLATGEMAESFDQFKRALNADADNQEAHAGRISAELFLASATQGVNGDGEDDDEALPEAGFDLLLAQGLGSLYHGDWIAAKERLILAAGTDPFRSYLAWRALSWLAEATGYPDEAFAFIELAHENMPTDAYTLFQRGRLLAQRDDTAGAAESFRSALDQELDFVDALVAMGVLAGSESDHRAAERYFERAIAIEPNRPVVHSRRGFNLFELGDNEGAQKAFERALSLNGELASARIGRSWAEYARGDSTEAKTQFAQLDDARRNEPEDDVFRVYAQSQIERITEHEAKEIWHDRFDRRPGNPVNGWSLEEGHGLEVNLIDGEVRIDGTITTSGRTRLFRELPGDRFVALECTVTIQAGSNARVGLFVSREKPVRGEWVVQAEVSVSRNADGGAVQLRTVKESVSSAPYVDLPETTWLTGQPMPLRVERAGDSNETTFTVFVDGIPVTDAIPMSSLGRSQKLRFGVFVEGEQARPAKVSVDNAEVIRRNS